jgi:uncharacterized membrane protein
VPVSTAIQTFLPIVLGPVFLRENWGSSLPIALGLALAAVGTVLVARSRAVSDLVAAASS